MSKTITLTEQQRRLLCQTLSNDLVLYDKGNSNSPKNQNWINQVDELLDLLEWDPDRDAERPDEY